MMHCHHEKLVIVDDELAFVGGIDLTALAGDRYDSNAHPHKARRDRLARRVLAAARADRARRRRPLRAALGGRPRARRSSCPRTLAPAGDVTVQFIRTVPEGAYDVLPRGEFSILESYVRALRSARHLIYLENQFLWSPEIVAILEAQAAQPADRRLPRRRPAAAQGQQRPGRHARDARPPRRRRRRPRELPRRDDPVAHRRALRPALRARQDRHRRRRAGWRSAPPTSTSTRSSTTPRSTSSRAIPRSPARPACGCGRSTSRAPADGDPATRGRRAVAPDRERAARAPPRRSATDPSPGRAARASAAVPGGCSARSTRSWSTANRPPSPR